MTFMRLCLWAFVFSLKKVQGFCFCSWRFKVLVFALRKVEGFCSYFWMLKVFTFTFWCERLLLLLLDVQSFYFWFRCWKFLLLFLDIEGFYFCSWMLKVLALILKCWRFFLLNVESSYFYSWMLKVCDSWSFVYLHIFKKMMWKYVPFYLEVDCTSLVWLIMMIDLWKVIF